MAYLIPPYLSPSFNSYQYYGQFFSSIPIISAITPSPPTQKKKNWIVFRHIPAIPFHSQILQKRHAL